MSHWADKPVKVRAINKNDKRSLQITIPAHVVRQASILDGESFKPEITDSGDLLYRRLTIVRT